MEKNELTPEESFAIINKAITSFKINYKEFASVFLLWGWVLSLASFSNFFILRFLRNKEAFDLMGNYTFANWAIFMVVGFAIMFVLLRKMDRSKKVYSHLDVYVNKLWKVSAISFFVAIFLAVKLGIAPPPLMLLIAGLATTTSGLLIKFKPMIVGGISFFLFSIASTFVTNEYLALLVGVSIVCGYLVPGYSLKSAKE